MSIDQRRELYLKEIEKAEKDKEIRAKKMAETGNTWKSLIEKGKNKSTFGNTTANSFWTSTEKAKITFKNNNAFSSALHNAFAKHKQNETLKTESDDDLLKTSTDQQMFKQTKEKLSLERLYENDQTDCVAAYSPTMRYKLDGKDPSLISEMYSTRFTKFITPHMK